VSLVAERNTPVRLSFADGVLTVEAGGTDDARASESMDAEFEGEELTIAFNPQFLLDGLSAIGTETAVFSFTAPTKPAVLTGQPSDDAAISSSSSYSYVLMPVRVSH
jgi:DNA polymerase-3 subunit beta